MDSDQPLASPRNEPSHSQSIIELVARKVEQSEGARAILDFVSIYAGIRVGLEQLAKKLDQQITMSAKTHRLIAWMRERAEAGESRKKILLRDAETHFSFSFTTREFGAAYKAAFGKKRGRPRREN